jgi:hypothetical protein
MKIDGNNRSANNGGEQKTLHRASLHRLRIRSAEIRDPSMQFRESNLPKAIQCSLLRFCND